MVNNRWNGAWQSTLELGRVLALLCQAFLCCQVPQVWEVTGRAGDIRTQGRGCLPAVTEAV